MSSTTRRGDPIASTRALSSRLITAVTHEPHVPVGQPGSPRPERTLAGRALPRCGGPGVHDLGASTHPRAASPGHPPPAARAGAGAGLGRRVHGRTMGEATATGKEERGSPLTGREQAHRVSAARRGITFSAKGTITFSCSTSDRGAEKHLSQISSMPKELISLIFWMQSSAVPAIEKRLMTSSVRYVRSRYATSKPAWPMPRHFLRKDGSAWSKPKDDRIGRGR